VYALSICHYSLPFGRDGRRFQCPQIEKESRRNREGMGDTIAMYVFIERGLAIGNIYDLMHERLVETIHNII